MNPRSLATLKKPLLDSEDTIRARVGERLQERRIDKREDRCVGSDAKRQRGHRDQRESRIAAKRSDGIANLLNGLFQRDAHEK